MGLGLQDLADAGRVNGQAGWAQIKHLSLRLTNTGKAGSHGGGNRLHFANKITVN